jgi:non-heme chloroperoxidase
MPTITTSDGATLFYKDEGSGPPILFSHGWPLSADAWDAQLLFFGRQGYRVVAHDRRSHGRSSQTWDGNHMDRYADDLAELIDALDLRELVLVGHSTGGGEVVRYVGRHGTDRVSKLVLLGAVPPLMLKTPDNPLGSPIAGFDAIREGVAADRSSFYLDLTLPFYGFNRPGAKISDGLRQSFWLMGLQGGIKGQYDCIREFSEVDYSDDLRRVDVPTLIVHGTDDQIVPIDASARASARLVPGAILEEIEGGSHGYAQTHPDAFNETLLAFISGEREAPVEAVLVAEPTAV